MKTAPWERSRTGVALSPARRKSWTGSSEQYPLAVSGARKWPASLIVRHEVVVRAAAQATFEPEAIIFAGTRQIMLVVAARAADSVGPAMGVRSARDIPSDTAARSGVASVGCIGNRVYTELGMTRCISRCRGRRCPASEQLDVVLNANAALESFHREAPAALS
jgi:hypothetical protein